MPERPFPKAKPHPWTGREAGASPPPSSGAPPAVAYAELEVTSNFSFLRGASHPEELVDRAADLGHAVAAIADLHTLAGVVRAFVAAKARRIPLAVGCRVEVLGARALAARKRRPSPPWAEVLLFATDVASYGRLSRLLTVGKRRAEKGGCRLGAKDLEEHHAGLLAVAIPPRDPEAGTSPAFAEALARLRALFGDDRLSLAASCLYGEDDRARLDALDDLARRAGVPLLATNDVHYHVPERRPLQDVLACVRDGVTVETAGLRLFAHAERHLKPPAEMARLFRGHGAALARAVEVARRAAAFSLESLRYRYPRETCPEGTTPDSHLAALVARGAAERYPAGVPADVRARLDHELSLVAELRYASYFLTVHDLVAFARSRGILCQGRGAAANSAVCYCLGVTALDPARIDMLFERFVSRERDEPPDIDVDFEHERREEVIQYLYRRYGRDRAALCAEVISYRRPSALRDVGKAMGLSLDAVDRLARGADHGGDGPPDVSAAGLDPSDATVARVLALSEELLGFPRHLSQHVGGFVITEGPLCEMVPVENAAMPDRTVIEWDKDDLDAMGMLKVDVLGLGMLTAIRKAFEHLERRAATLEATGAASREAGAPPPAVPHLPASTGFSLHTIPPEDPAVYEMLCRADSVGVFQIESRAQMAMLPRLRPRRFYDLVIEVAIVRPGPIQGRMVHPYLRRRGGEEPVAYPSAAVERVLGKTLGVPLFQEQAMSLAMVAAGFTPGEADRLRRSMAAWKRRSKEILLLGERLVEGMVEHGLPREFAERCFAQIQGFSEYGFPESHAASFALLVYASAWLKHHHPAAFTAALLDAQPMGFYAPAQLVRDARAHGVDVRPVDVHHSGWDCRLEEREGGDAPRVRAASRPAAPATPPSANPGAVPDRGPALRLGMRLVKGMAKPETDAIADAVAREGPFRTPVELFRASGVRATTFRRLAAADAFGSMGLSRRAALWQVRALRDESLPLFVSEPDPCRGLAVLPAPTPSAEVTRDYRTVSLSLKGHPVAFLRGVLDARGAALAGDVADERRFPHGADAAVAGVVLCRQRPSTAGGILFVTIEDESGAANLIVRPDVYERYRAEAVRSGFLLARGRVERRGLVVHLLVRSLERLDPLFEGTLVRSRDFR